MLFFSFIDWVCGLWKGFLLIMLLDCLKIYLKIIIQPHSCIIRMWYKCCIYLKSQELQKLEYKNLCWGKSNSGSIQIIYLRFVGVDSNNLKFINGSKKDIISFTHTHTHAHTQRHTHTHTQIGWISWNDIHYHTIWEWSGRDVILKFADSSKENIFCFSYI